MKVEFGDTRLQRCFEDSREATRLWGDDVARRYIQRVALLQSASDWNQLVATRSLRLHPLGGDRRGQWSMTLHSRWRLLVVPNEADRTVRIEEVSNHYGD